MIPQTAKEIGAFGERRAARFLRLHGYRVRQRNWHSGKQEIDIIASNLHDLAFVEVKTRTYANATEIENAPPPRLAVDAQKRRLTRLAASRYLQQYPTKKQPRMDVIEVWLLREDPSSKPKVAKIHHMKAAY